MDLTYEKQRSCILKTVAEMVADRLDRPERAEAWHRAMLANLSEDETYFDADGSGGRGYAVLIVNRHITTMKKMTDVENFLDRHKERHKFLVVPKRAKTLKDQVKAFGPQLELFTISELLANISRHVIVPKHVLLSKERADRVLAEYNTTIAELPKMYDSDPMARYIGARAGDMVEIIRPSIVSGYSSAFRAVVPEPIVS